jgi:hypothetical protein
VATRILKASIGLSFKARRAGKYLSMTYFFSEVLGNLKARFFGKSLHL